MRILVIDDSPVQQAAARQTIIGHDLEVVGSADRALELLGVRVSNRGKIDCAKPFEVVLCDMMMPPPTYLQRKIWLPNEDQVAIGFPLTLIAVRAGAKYVAMVTETDHHEDPMCAVLEAINGYDNLHPFKIDEAKILYLEQETSVLVDGTTCTRCMGAEVQTCYHCGKDGLCGCSRARPMVHACYTCRGTNKGRGKNWGYILQLLTAT